MRRASLGSVETPLSAVAQMRDRFHRGTAAGKALTLAELEALLQTKALGGRDEEQVCGVTTLDRPRRGYLAFVVGAEETQRPALEKAAAAGTLLIAPEDCRSLYPGCLLPAEHPRAAFAAALRALFPDYGRPCTVAVDPSAAVDPSVGLSVGVVIGPNTAVGADTVIHPNVVIGPNVTLGRRCVVKSGTVIGQPGFGVHRKADDRLEVMPHVGGVVIGDEVELGALNTVVSGTIHPTLVAEQVKTDDHVHIAHNCAVGPQTLITACAEISGSVAIGAGCWIGPNAAIRDGLSLGDRAFVGIGSVVVEDVPADTTVYGSPARPKRT